MAEPHEILGVPADADEATVREAYRDLLKEHHPDHGGSADRFIRVRRAYEALADSGPGGSGLAASVARTVRGGTDPGTSADRGTSDGSGQSGRGGDGVSGSVDGADAGSGTDTAATGRDAASGGTAERSPGSAPDGASRGGSGGSRTGTAGTTEVTARPVSGASGLELVTGGYGLTVSLVALTDSLPAEALLPDHVEVGRRLAACFRVENRTAEPATWEARRVRFVGSQGERYLPSVYRPKRRNLPEGWRGDDVEIPAGATAHSFLLSRALPADVAVAAVVYDQSSSAGPDRRMRFELDGATRVALDRDPFA